MAGILQRPKKKVVPPAIPSQPKAKPNFPFSDDKTLMKKLRNKMKNPPLKQSRQLLSNKTKTKRREKH